MGQATVVKQWPCENCRLQLFDDSGVPVKFIYVHGMPERVTDSVEDVKYKDGAHEQRCCFLPYLTNKRYRVGEITGGIKRIIVNPHELKDCPELKAYHN